MRFTLPALLALGLLLVGCWTEEPRPQANQIEQVGDDPVTVDRILDRTSGLIDLAKREGSAETYRQAELLLQDALKLQDQQDRIYVALGNLYLESSVWTSIVARDNKEIKQRTFLAQKMFKNAIVVNPTNDEALIGLAQCASYLHDDYEKSLKLYEDALKLDPENPETIFQIGIALFELKRYPEAEKRFTEVLKIAEETGAKGYINRVKEFLGRIYTKSGRYELAERTLKDVTERLDDTDGPEEGLYWGCPYSALGELYTLMGQQGQATEQHRKAAETAVFKPNAQFAAALAYYADNDLTNAMKYTRRAIDLGNYPPAVLLQHSLKNKIRRARTGEPALSLDLRYYEIALFCFGIGDNENALPYINRALAISDKQSYKMLKNKILLIDVYGDDLDLEFDDDGEEKEPSIADAEFTRALALYQEGRYERSLASIERALFLEKRGCFQVLKGYLLLLEQNYGEAELLFDAAATEDDARQGAGVGLGHLNIARKQYPQATEKLQPVVDDRRLAAADLGSYDWLVYEMACLGMGWTMHNQNRPQDALPYFEKILAVDSRDLLALLGKGNSLLRSKSMAKAKELYEKVLGLYPGNPYALAELAIIKYNLGEDKEAEEGFKKALARDAEHYTCPYEGLGLVYLRQGKLDQAKKNFEKAIEINPEIQYQKFNGLALIYIKEGRTEEARKLLNQSLKNHPYDDNEAHQLLAQLGPDADAGKENR